MYWQRELYRSGAAWSNGGTYRLELPDAGLLGSILIHAYRAPVTDSMVATEKWRLEDYISELKIVGNGNRVLKSVSGQVQKYLAFLDGGGPAPDKAFNYGSSTFRFHTALNFGRRLFDIDYGLDLAAWDSVELQFTNDGSATYFGGDWSIDVLLYYLREAAATQFKGYLKTEEWRKWTTVSDEWKYLDLPTEELLRRIVMQVIPDVDANNVAEATPYNVAYEIELKLRSGAVDVWDANLRHLWYDNFFHFGKDAYQCLEPYTTDEKGIHTGLGQTLGVGGVRLPHDSNQDTYATSIEPGLDSSTLKRYADGDSDQDGLLVFGLALENCAVFPFDQQDDPAQYLDLARDGTVQLNVHTRSGAAYADGTIRVILDRMVRGQGPRG